MYFRRDKNIVDRLYELVESGEIYSRTIALELISWMSADDVEEFCRQHGYDDAFPELIPED